MAQQPRSLGLLRSALIANAGFSFITGLALVIGSTPLSNWLGIPQGLALSIGFALLPFAVVVAMAARKPRQALVREIVTADLVWVLGAVIVILGFPEEMSGAGLWALGLATGAVTGFAGLQMLGLRREEPAAWER